MSADPYLKRAEEAVAAAKKKVRGYKGDCSDCIYSKSTWYDDLVCVHPAVELVAFNLTDADAKEYIVGCGEQRDRDSVWGPVVCGPDGALFEPAEKKAGLLSRLFGQSA